jgi:hypothetical protein
MRMITRMVPSDMIPSPLAGPHRTWGLFVMKPQSP